MSVSASITVGFETSHRLAHFGGECASLHGHSWKATITVAAEEVGADGTVVDFHALREAFGGWVAEHLNHAVMLAADDPLTAILREHQCRVYRFGAGDASTYCEHLAVDLPHPTVENVAVLLSRVADLMMGGMPWSDGAPIYCEHPAAELSAAEGSHVVRVDVDEAPGSRASWTRS